MRPLPELLILASLAASAAAADVFMNIRNDSNDRVKLSWVNHVTKERVLMYKLEADSQKGLNTYPGHVFEIQQLGSCENGNSCSTKMFTMTQVAEQAYIIDEDFDVVEVENLEDVPMRGEQPIEPNDLLAKCRGIAAKQLEEETDRDAQDRIFRAFQHCLTNGLAPSLRVGENEIDFETEIRETVASDMENFTCTDPDFETSPDVDTREWISERDEKPRVVHVKLDRPASRIHVIENFAYPEECQAVEDYASNKLHTASTADGKGGSQVSQNRKALQAGISPAWNKEADGDLIARLSRRVYDYVNYELGLDIDEHGQEPLMSIQYNGRGYTDITPDRYTPHCDGGCGGDPHDYGTRMATMVIYCTIPERGGHTNFQNANVHVKPEVGSGIFFSYIDPATNKTDTRLTQHSGCPVYEGEKKIVTQWVRYGVTKETPHSAYNTLGILKRDASD